MTSVARAGRRADLAIILALFLLPLLWFAPQTVGGKTLLPAENLYTFEPWAGDRVAAGAGDPQNPLISDLVLENLQWKSFIVEALRAGEAPLWNPRLFAGVPFLAAGQHSALYPPSLLFYVLPLWLAYGLFTALQLGIAGAGLYIFARLLGLARPAAVLAAIAYTFSGFFIVSVNFSMIIAAAAWLPLVLACIEQAARAQERQPDALHAPGLWVAAGAAVLGVQILAGHIEITYYVLMVSSFFSLWRLAALWRRTGRRPALLLAAWLLALAGLGLGLGGVQLLPLYELVSQSFREGSAGLRQVLDWAWPARQIVTFVLPDAFGNPTHHSYFDIWQRAWIPVTQNALGEPLSAIDWGKKNYVEAGNYLGIATMLLAALAFISLATARRMGGAVPPARAAAGQERSAPPGPPSRRFYVALFGVLALLSLLFAFGTPLYAVLFYLVPGYGQLHSAFRWVFPYTLSMALLAGFGLDLLLRFGSDPGVRRPARLLALAAAAAGALALVLVALSAILPAPFVALGQRLLDGSDLAQARGFANGAMAWSYEAAGIARFGIAALLSGAALLWLLRRPRPDSSRSQLAAALPAVALVAILLGDLFAVGGGFNPATDRHLLEYTPPVVAWLRDRLDAGQPWRFTTLDRPGEKLMNANSAMQYGLEDIRGYDSIIPRQYVRYLERLYPQGELLYNRIAPLYSQPGDAAAQAPLASPLFHLLGVRYVVSTQPVLQPGYRQVYSDGRLQVYENANALPRAFIAAEGVAAPGPEAALDRLASVDPRETVVVEGIPADEIAPRASPQVREARISRRDMRQVFVDVNISDRGWLVLADNYFPGWKAYLREFGTTGEGVTASGEASEQELPVYRADGSFRAVYLPQAGQWSVRFVYSPRSFQLGIYISFLAGVVLLLAAGWWAWARFYRGDRSELGTVAKNSTVQVVLSLLNKAIDTAFAMLRLRVLGPAGQGSFAFAISFYMVFEIVTRFGLGTLLTRDVARDRENINRYLVNVVVLRIGLWFVSLPFIYLMALAYRVNGRLSVEEGQTIAIFAAAMLFANLADAITAVFNGLEKMEYPAALATVTTVAKVALGALVLLPPFGLGFVGLALVSLVTNMGQVIWLYLLLRRAFPRPAHERGGVDRRLQWQMLRESGPLMINHLLASLFWRISQFALPAFAGVAALGIFSVGVAFLDGLNVIPAYFTLAIFPLMSRYAQDSGGSLLRAYRLAVQLLFIVALPIAVFFTFAAVPLVRILGGAAYLPDSATALAIMIWSIPIGFVNSVSQYALIAVGQQQYLTRAFIIGVVFTAAANLILVPRYGYLAAALILVPAELSLFLPFHRAVVRHIGPVSWRALAWRPLAAALSDVAVTAAVVRSGASLPLAIVAGGATYVVILVAIGAFRSQEFDILFARLRPHLPFLARAGTGEGRP